MRSLVPVLLIGLVVSACAQTTSSETGAADTASADSAPRVEDATVDDAPLATVEQQPDPEPAPTQAPPDTEAPDPDPVATEPPAEEPPPASSPTPSPPGAAFDGVVTFYAGSGFTEQPWAPVGWWDGASWRQTTFDADGVASVAPEPDLASVSATSLDLDGGEGDGVVIDGLSLGPRTEYCVGEETGPLIDIGIEVPDTPASLGYDIIAATVDWPLHPRPVRQVGLEAPEYSEIGADLFAEVPDAATTGDVIQVVRVDLDGDTIEEVLVTYENITNDFGAAGDFSGVYARYPSADGTVVDELVVGHVPEEPTDFPTIGRHTLAAVADLNGDGVMEVVVRDTFWEYGGMTVYALEGGRLVSVTGGGCGV